MTGARSDPSESRDILTDHAYPLTNKESEGDVLEVVERFRGPGGKIADKLIVRR